ncbi:hypothetical protein [Ponticaulis sp.]|uniref:hypothetical protein n=1 Tax=Ponticaulis sp. TaxID=2020902 RepID=UPI000B6D6206|nr:hypothetical protein [Ponticaulis sp.]MAJ07990.1 hypothetical protein [Ponticaulis sp.]RPG18298.1 MAG: hypothetical protein CBC85_003455 [Hyphomonadaceae bacterium TMED125]HBH91190.1 hypothetical protein [Hyphomonadaceae bacterium]HBJ92141.1 hypothetical protein [Hyphomonadaceae bacterium]|tara:strand:- start:1618 stop:2274 length:657 start_codon:yes stop_codon:yes gene_type:complete
MTRPDTWPFDKYLRDDETIIWRQRQVRAHWGRIALCVLFGIFCWPVTYFGERMLFETYLEVEFFDFLQYAVVLMPLHCIAIVGFLSLIGIPRSFFYHYALTNKRVLIVNTFLGRDYRSLPGSWMNPSFILPNSLGKTGTVKMPCAHMLGLGGIGKRTADWNIAAHGTGYSLCWMCAHIPKDLIGVSEPQKLANLIKTTLSPLQQADQKAREAAHPDYG